MNSNVEGFDFVWRLAWIPSVAFFGYVIWRYVVAILNKPSFRKDEIAFQEFFASGASQKNILTKFGDARNCLRLVVARDFLWITSWFPFSLIAPFYDLEHVVPLRNIASVENNRLLGFDGLILNFIDQHGRGHSLRISPRNREVFLRVLGLEQSAKSS